MQKEEGSGREIVKDRRGILKEEKTKKEKKTKVQKKNLEKKEKMKEIKREREVEMRGFSGGEILKRRDPLV